jgi:16S rRNA (guanine527-N7)-methyltransferase
LSDALGKEDGESRELDAWAKEFGVPLPGPVREDLLKFARLLLLWGQRINLTAAKSVAALVADHLPDAFAIAGRLALPGGAGRGGERIIDVGSGGGLPGIPLALLRPDSELTLVEATGKKVAFLRTAARELGLSDRVMVEHRRMDPEGADEKDGGFDVAVSRAMLAPADWLPLGRRLVRPGGRVFCLASHALTAAPIGLDLADQVCYRRGGPAERWVAELRRST